MGGINCTRPCTGAYTRRPHSSPPLARWIIIWPPSPPTLTLQHLEFHTVRCTFAKRRKDSERRHWFVGSAAAPHTWGIKLPVSSLNSPVVRLFMKHTPTPFLSLILSTDMISCLIIPRATIKTPGFNVNYQSYQRL